MGRFTTRSDGTTVDLKKEEANQADIAAGAKKVIITDGTEKATVSAEGYLDVAAHGEVSRHDGTSVSFRKDGINTATGYVLIDLSDTTNYPHLSTTHLGIDWIIITGLASSTAVGYYDIGFITRIDETNSDWQSIFHGHFDKKEERFEVMLNMIPQSIMCLVSQHLSGGELKITSDTIFQNDATVEGVYSATTTPAVGDLVLKVTLSAGTADMAVAVGYHSH